MSRVLTAEKLDAARRGFKTAFQLGLTSTAAIYQSLATVINSDAPEELYGWLGSIPKMREWIGARHIHGLTEKAYSIKNRKFELTVSVNADDIFYDRLGVYRPRFEMLGNSVALHPDETTMELVTSGASLPCFDGNNFFDTDHPVGKPGAVTSVSNYAAGGSNLWILADLSKPLKPWIYQKVGEPSFVNKEDPKSSDHVFMNDEYVYGADVRGAVGFGFWQMAYGATVALDATNLKAAWQAMSALTDDEGRKLNIKPTHLLVGSSNVFKARELLLSETIGGSSNTLRNLVQTMELPLLD